MASRGTSSWRRLLTTVRRKCLNFWTILLAKYFSARGAGHALVTDPSVRELHRRLKTHLRKQKLAWKNPYAGNWFYQGYFRIGIWGLKPCELRLERYGIQSMLDKNHVVLDIGSNAGFWAIHLSQFVQRVDGIEFNPHLVAIGEETRRYLEVTNVKFVEIDFERYQTPKKYDVVFSLSNHHTIDGKLDMGFERYIKKIFALLRPGGLLVFESHNVFGSGRGDPGDDGDLDSKFDIVEQYFDVIDYKMVSCFYPAADVDKLLVILKRKSQMDPKARRSLSRKDAIRGYQFKYLS